MKNLFYITISIALLLSGSAYADCLRYWDQGPIRISQCENNSGRSGYYQLENRSSNTYKVCWDMRFNNGKKETGCRILDAYYEGTGVCYSCNPKNGGGVRSLTFTKIERR